MRGIIAIEGADGAGKTTLAAAMLREFKSRHVKALCIKRPDTTGPAYALLRAPTAHLSRAEQEDRRRAILAAMDDDCRASLAKAKEWLEDGHADAIILDRHYLSAAVYQGASDWRSEHERQRRLWGEPDAWIFCDASPGELHCRVTDRGGHDVALTCADLESHVHRYRELICLQCSHIYWVSTRKDNAGGIDVRRKGAMPAKWDRVSDDPATAAARAVVADLMEHMH